jgi:hypothetical protein
MKTPFDDIRTLVQWMLDEDDRFDDIRTAYGNDPEQCEYVNETEAALYRVSDWLDEVSPDHMDSDDTSDRPPAPIAG